MTLNSEALLAQCEAKLAAGDGLKALILARSGMEMLSMSSHTERYWAFRTIAAEVLSRSGQALQAMEVIGVIPADLETQLPEIFLRLLSVLAYAQLLLGRYSEVEETCARIHLDAQRLGDDVAAGGAELQMGNLRFRQGRLSEARQHFNAAESIGAKHNKAQLEISGAMGAAKVVMQTSGHSAALPIFKQGLAKAMAMNNRLLMGLLAGEAGNCCCYTGDLEEAEELLEQALELGAEVGNSANQHIIIANLGNLWMKRGQIQKARDYFTEALRLSLDVQDPFSIMRWNYNLALVNLEMEDYEAALRFAHDAYEGHLRLNDIRGTSKCLALSAEINRQRVQSTRVFDSATTNQEKGSEL